MGILFPDSFSESLTFVYFQYGKIFNLLFFIEQRFHVNTLVVKVDLHFTAVFGELL